MASEEGRWYQRAIFYELYVRAFRDSNGDGHGDLRGVIEKLDYLQELGVDCIWLMPIYPSPLKDDGYDISDYCGIHPDYGTLTDFEDLLAEAHARGLRIIMDLVINHTSDQHPWFVESRSARSSPKRDWYVWSDTDRRFAGARIIFVDTEQSNWAFDARTRQYYWHRFYSSQPDLNYDNPEVRQAIQDIMRFWLEKGIDGFRVDAVPYLFEREGTNCENLPETHAFIKEMRRTLDVEWPDAMILAEANQPPEEVRAYFGRGDEFHMAFNFPLMPRIFLALYHQRAELIRDMWNRIPEIPQPCQWCTFLRNHDELTLEMVTEEERQMMWQIYAPHHRMRLNLGIRRRLAPLLDDNVHKIMLANAILFSLPGAPILYYGDEIGMGDNLELTDRNGLRSPMQWNAGKNAGFSDAPAERLYNPVIGGTAYGYQRRNVAQQQADTSSVFHQTRRLIAIHKQFRALASGSLEFLDVGNPAILAMSRSLEGERLVILHNLSGQAQRAAAPRTAFQGSKPEAVWGGPSDLETGAPWPETRPFDMTPYQSLWLLAKG